MRELGGLVFAYMGPLPAPALPRWDLYVWPNAIRQIAVNVLDCNWLQCQENTADPTHSVWAHGHYFQYELERSGQVERAQADLTTRCTAAIKMGVGHQGPLRRADAVRHAKGIVYSKELGADADSVEREPTR